MSVTGSQVAYTHSQNEPWSAGGTRDYAGERGSNLYAPVERKSHLAIWSEHRKDLSKIHKFNMERHLSIFDGRQMNDGQKAQTYQSTRWACVGLHVSIPGYSGKVVYSHNQLWVREFGWLKKKETQVKAMRSNSSSGRKGGMRDTNNTGKQLDREKTETREGVNYTEKDDESLEKARAWWKDTMSYKDNGDKRDKCSEDAQARYRMRRERVCDGKAWQKAAGNRRAPLLQHIGSRIQTPKDAARPHQWRKWSTYTWRQPPVKEPNDWEEIRQAKLALTHSNDMLKSWKIWWDGQS